MGGRSRVRRSTAWVVRQAAQRTHRNQCLALSAHPIVGENTVSRGRASVRTHRDPIATANEWRARAQAQNLTTRELIIEVTGRQNFIGSPDTVAKGIERLLGFSNGGFGGVLFRANEWATREQILRSYELFARYVMPRFQGSLDTIVNSNQWAKDNRKGIFGPNVAALKKAFTDAGREAPEAFRDRTPGARDVAGD